MVGCDKGLSHQLQSDLGFPGLRGVQGCWGKRRYSMGIIPLQQPRSAGWISTMRFDVAELQGPEPVDKTQAPDLDILHNDICQQWKGEGKPEAGRHQAEELSRKYK